MLPFPFLPHLNRSGYVILFVVVAAWQPPASAQDLHQELEAANQRVTALEARIGKLEGLMYASMQLSVYDAKRRMAAAVTELEQNRRLYNRGLLLSIELERSQYEVDRARRELELARCESGHHHYSAQIDLLDAEFELKLANDHLERNREAAARGLVTTWQLEKGVEAVDRAKKSLEFARQKLEALGPFEPPVDPENQPPKPEDK
jgi:multidrug resistance efflux pump